MSRGCLLILLVEWYVSKIGALNQPLSRCSLFFFECICLMFDFYIFREISDPSVCCV